MLSITHSLTGALIASTIQHPILSVPVVLASHYLEDWIPHWDVGTGLSTGKRKRSTAILLELIELGISAFLLYFFWKDTPLQTQFYVWYGAFWGLLPDFIEAPRNFLKWEPFFLKPLNEFHGNFHHSIRNVAIGLAPQVLLWIFIFLVR